jgi:DNA processing protein
MQEELKYLLALSQVPQVGPVMAKQLMSILGSAEEVMKAKVKSLQKIEGIGEVRAKSIAAFDDYKAIEKEILFAEKHEIQILHINSEAYPTQLKQCLDSPIALFYKGNADLNTDKIVSIIGRRQNTDYGKRITEEIVKQLKPYNPLIISGLAYGIDVIAHKAALQNGLQTVGVLAHGLDSIYPAAHKPIAKEMLAQGGLISEYFSGSKAAIENFPMRNRIVAGMSAVTIVVETDIKGGSMITANLANGYNKEVMAVPGSVFSNASSGCHHLIKTLKANMITSGNDIAALLNWESKSAKQKVKQRQLFIQLSASEQLIMDELQKQESVHIDDITINTKLTPSEIAIATLNLEMQGIIGALPGKFFRLLG